MSWTNDAKPSGSVTNDSGATIPAMYGSAKYGYSLYGTTENYTTDTKPSGSYSNDTKPT